MIGNDVIDLGDPETRAGACHARFDARVFADTERALLVASVDPVRCRWTLWAAKEAAYKAARQLDAATTFSPRRFVVELHGTTRAIVRDGARRFAVALESGPRHVHAIATAASVVVSGAAFGAESQGEPRGPHVVARVERLAPGDVGCPGDAVRALTVATLAPLLGIAAHRLSVERAGRVPRLACDGAPLTVGLSLSHHGRSIAFACMLPRAATMSHIADACVDEPRGGDA